MPSVTQIIKNIKQPYGGYIKPSDFEEINLDIKTKLNDNETVVPALIGLAVDYLSRFLISKNKDKAFEISKHGAHVLSILSKNFNKSDFDKLFKNISFKLTDKCIDSAIRLTGFDCVYRAGVATYKDINSFIIDDSTIKNVRIMVERSIDFFKEYGPVKGDGFSFYNPKTKESGYTEIITIGDGDFYTENVLWDFKVSKNKITSAHTLQVLIYYIMGIHANLDDFKTINKLGFFNPRLNKVYLFDLNKIDKEIIKEVEKNVIGYK
ncbi:MAG: hypothetical protein ACRCRP_02480 [Metamycoplasmataceae bacterium]